MPAPTIPKTSVKESIGTSTGRTRLWLACGVLAGPLSLTTVLVQAFSRSGFDPSRHYLSQLSLGDLGWIQITNFITCGLLVMASAVGLRAALRGERAGTWGPRLFGVYGLGLIWAGIFLTDPANGFPPGTPNTGDSTWHGQLHNVAPIVIGLALDIACLVFARRFYGLGQSGWAAYSLATVVGDIATAVIAGTTGDYRWLLAGAVLTWGWAAVVTAHVLYRQLPTASRARQPGRGRGLGTRHAHGWTPTAAQRR